MKLQCIEEMYWHLVVVTCNIRFPLHFLELDESSSSSGALDTTADTNSFGTHSIINKKK